MTDKVDVTLLIEDETSKLVTDEVDVTPLSETDARQLTNEVRNGIDYLGKKLLEVYRRRAWESLNYKNFVDYARTEFQLAKNQAYNLLTDAKANYYLFPEIGEEVQKIPVSQKKLLMEQPPGQRVDIYREAQKIAKAKGRKVGLSHIQKVVDSRDDSKTDLNSDTDLDSDTESVESSSEINSSEKIDNSDDTESSESIPWLKKQLIRKTRALNETLRILDQTRKEVLELRKENNRLANLLNSLGS